MPPAISAVAFITSLVIGAPIVALKVVGVFLLNLVASKLFGPKVPSGVGLRNMQVMGRSSLEHRKIVYGQAMVSGPIVYNNVQGNDNEFLWYVIALADGLSDDLIEVWFDGDSIPKADIDWVAGTGTSDGTGTGDVSTAKWVGDNSTNAVQIYYYLGDDDQPVSGDLNTAFSDIGTNHRMRGVTHIVCQLLYNEDTENVWKQGPPNNIKVVVKGRLIYDPRLDSTQIIDPTTSPVTLGSGSHRTADATTWAWSDNPALCVADYLFNVMTVVPATGIDWASIADAADDCDVLVVVPSPENTETRFTCNGALSLGSTHKDNLDSLLSSCDGKLAYSAGVWKLRASVWESSSVTITANDLSGPVEVRGSSPKSERFNKVRGFFIDPSRKYESAEFPHVSDPNYLIRDNSEVISFDLNLPMTNTATMAQRIAYRNLEQSNNQTFVVLNMNVRGAKVTVGDVVTLEFSELNWTVSDDEILLETSDNLLLETGEPFFLESSTAPIKVRCIEWNRNVDSTYKVTFREDKETSYTDPSAADYGFNADGGLTQPSDVTPAPSNLVATGVPSGIKLTWDNPPTGTYDFIVIYEATSNNWSTSPEQQFTVVRVDSDTYTAPHQSGEIYYYWIRALQEPDLFSDRNPDSDITTIFATSGLDAGSTPVGVVTAIGRNLIDFTVDPTTAIVGYRINSDGDVYTRKGVGDAWSSIGTWLNSGSASDYDVLLEDLGTGTDTPTGSAVDTWINAGSSITWELEATSTSIDPKTFYSILKFRDGTTSPVSAVLESASVSLQAWMIEGV